MGGFLILILVLGVFWMLFVLPRRRKMGQHRAMQNALATGDDVITAGGLHGIIKELGEDTVEVEIAPSVVVTLDRRAIAAVATEIEVEVEADPEPEPEVEDGTPLEPS